VVITLSRLANDAKSVGDVEIACGVHADAYRPVQQGAGCRAVIAAVARVRSHHGGDHPVRNLADAVVTHVGDVEVADGIHGDALETGQLGAGGGAVVAAEPICAISRRGGDYPVRTLRMRWLETSAM